MLEKISISSKGEFVDTRGRVVQLRGVNFDPSIKYPNSPKITTHAPLDNSFWDTAGEVSFVGHPIKLEELEEHINRLKSLGYNTVRFCFSWEALEHEGPEQYDFEYLEYIRKVISKIYELGDMYVYLDPHQDVWSRFTGGSGAPLWTLFCAGFNPKRFAPSQACILHNEYIDKSTGEAARPYPKMFWPTNYYRLACQTMFTLFFGGKKFAPKCIINGVNIQDYLQSCFNNAVFTLYEYLLKNSPELFEGNCILGIETMNEPNEGYIGYVDLSAIPSDRDLKVGPTPTAFQSFLTGEGFETVVDTYSITIAGPKKVGTSTINPRGESAWMTNAERDEYDKQYDWVRGEEWLPGCIWRLHNVWDVVNGHPRLLDRKYFSRNNVNMKFFMNNMFISFFEGFRNSFRTLDTERFIFLQNPVFQRPPELKGSPLIDNNTVFSTHFYDGMSLMFKTWNKIYNVDTLGIVRGKYFNPVLSLVLGEQNIKKSFRKQLNLIAIEAREVLGDHVPIVFSEIGMPFDMDDKLAYKTGHYKSQTSAMDAIGYALESNNFSFSLWCYCTQNCHEWGDQWNNEDFSVWSPDDMKRRSIKVEVPHLGSASVSLEEIATFTARSTDSSSTYKTAMDTITFDYSGFRALEAILRPYPMKISGSFLSAKFDPYNGTYELHVHGHAGPKNTTFVFLPAYHFKIDSVVMRSSSGHFAYDPDKQILQWNHEPGSQYLLVSTLESSEGDDACSLM